MIYFCNILLLYIIRVSLRYTLLIKRNRVEAHLISALFFIIIMYEAKLLY